MKMLAGNEIAMLSQYAQASLGGNNLHFPGHVVDRSCREAIGCHTMHLNGD